VRRILVTGGAGYIGSHTCKRAKNGGVVVCARGVEAIPIAWPDDGRAPRLSCR
jgi:nucleoside-diphosphate-sugar epimerase